MYYNNEKRRNHPKKVYDHMDYKDILAAYKGKINIQLNHNIVTDMIPSSKQVAVNYFKALRNFLEDFHYAYCAAKDADCYSFKKFTMITENFVLNNSVYLICYNTRNDDCGKYNSEEKIIKSKKSAKMVGNLKA